MSKHVRNPSNWDDYQYGPQHRDSIDSTTRSMSVRFLEDQERSRSRDNTEDDEDDEERDHVNQDLRRRRSSVALRFNAFTHLGGVNSIENFARSWSRAAAFPEVAPIRPAFVLVDDDHENGAESTSYERTDIQNSQPRSSLLRQHLENQTSTNTSDTAVEDWDESNVETPRPTDVDKRLRLESDLSSVQGASVRGSMRYNSLHGSYRPGQSVFGVAPHLATSLVGSYGTSYGTVRSALNESSMRHAADLWREQQESGAAPPDGQRPPLLVKEVEQDGEIILVVEGQSTLPQTIFNCTNTLIGIGLLSLPLGLKYAGWIIGIAFLTASAVVTAYTARLLAKCMDADKRLVTFADLAFISFGQKARIFTGFLFTLELLAASVALLIIFSDTLDLLVPGVGVTQWKVLCGLLLIPLHFLPLRFLSFTSVLGIFSTLSIVIIVFLDGFIKPQAPGSLRHPAETFLLPANWLALPLSFGLLMSPWGAHSVFPTIYRDMRHPYKWPRAITRTFTFTYFLDTATAIAGLLMFGDGVMDEITSNLIGNSAYPRFLTIMMCIFVAIIPLTKIPLNTRPIISTIEVMTGLDVHVLADADVVVGMSATTRGIIKIIVRIGVVAVLVAIAVAFPAFDSVVAFMGAALVFSVSVIMPLAFHLKMFYRELSAKARFVNWVLIIISTTISLIGTVWAFLPKSMIGMED